MTMKYFVCFLTVILLLNLFLCRIIGACIRLEAHPHRQWQMSWLHSCQLTMLGLSYVSAQPLP